MPEPNIVISETTLGYDLFRPLWGLLVLGAVAHAQPDPPTDSVLGDYVASRRDAVDALLGVLRGIGRFSDETMAIFEAQGGWRDDRPARSVEETAMDLVLFSGFLEPYPVDLDDAPLLARIVAMGVDVQLTHLLGALVAAAQVADLAPADAAGRVVDAMGKAGSLAGGDPRALPAVAFRAWRVACLPSVLRPDSPAPAAARQQLRTYVRELETLLVSR